MSTLYENQEAENTNKQNILYWAGGTIIYRGPLSLKGVLVIVELGGQERKPLSAL